MLDAPPSDGGGVRFSLVVLCYRSEENIVPLVEKLHKILGFYKFSYELVLVGNYFEGSTDKTPAVVRRLESQYPNTRAVVLPKQGMMGWDMRAGLDAARGDVIGVIDGDGQFPLESIMSCMIKLETEGYDLVKTYRVRRGDGLYRRTISTVYNLLFGWLFGTRYYDINSKPKIIRRSKYNLMELSSDDWFTDAEIMIRARELDLKVAELPIHFYTLDGRKSFVRPQAILEFIRNLWRFRHRRRTTRNPRPANAAGNREFDKFSKSYSNVLDQCISFSGEGGSEYFARCKADYVARLANGSKPSKILDYGCGVGLLTKNLLERFPKASVEGYDVSAESLKSAEAELARKVRFTADAASLGSDYSLIVVANVFHHIEPAQRKATFAALRKLLALGGRLVVFEHNPFNPATQWIVDRCAFDENAVLLPSSETIDGMKAAGLTPERRDFISFVPGFLAPLQPLERFLGWCPAGAQYAAVGRRVD